MNVVFLGSGSAIPIPRGHDGRSGYRGALRPARAQRRIHDCPQCRSRDVRDRRLSSAIVIDGRVLIDAGPAIGELLSSVDVPPDGIAAILLTHRHRDAGGGLQIMRQRSRIVFPAGPALPSGPDTALKPYGFPMMGLPGGTS